MLADATPLSFLRVVPDLYNLDTSFAARRRTGLIHFAVESVVVRLTASQPTALVPWNSRISVPAGSLAVTEIIG